MAAGITEPDLFEWGRGGNVYRYDALTPEIVTTVLTVSSLLKGGSVRL